jgi:hypothetical protein
VPINVSLQLAELHQRALLDEAEATRRARLARSAAPLPEWRAGLARIASGGSVALDRLARAVDPGRVGESADPPCLDGPLAA